MPSPSPSLTSLNPAPTVATIDQNFLLTANWTPAVADSGHINGWSIALANIPSSPVTLFTDGTDFGGTLTRPSYERALNAGDYSMNMMTLAFVADPVYQDSNPWDNTHPFPPPLTSSTVAFDNQTLLLGQTLTITLSNLYSGVNYDSSNISGWQVIYPDGTSSGILALTSRVVTKIFNTPGQQNIIVQTFNDFSTATPAVKLMRSFTFSVFVMNQQFGASSASSITSTLGIGGEAGFELVDNSSLSTTPGPYEMISRSLVRDTVTNELKLLVATSRYSNASSLLGTMALDVFPLNGRPQVSELLEPPVEVVAGSSSISPVTILTTALPGNAFIGMAVEYFKFMSASGGTGPYSWFSNGLPPGLEMSIDGTISGTPIQLGNFTVNFSVMDSSSPAFIAETTLNFNIPTNLAITTASLPTAVVLTPYNTQLTNTGGLLPFTWSVQGGALPVGLVLNQSTGIISGTPCSYRTADFDSNFSVTIQCQDAVGALASSTYSIVLLPAALQFGSPDQPNIFAGHAFQIVVPIFGGKSPYNFIDFFDDGTYELDPNLNNSHTTDGPMSNGQFELSITVPETAIGVHNFTITVQDSNATTVTKTIYYNVGTEVSNILIPEASIDWVWESNTDTTTIIDPLTGPLSGFLLNQDNTLVLPDDAFTQPIGLTVSVIPDVESPSSPPMSPPITGPAVEVAGPPTAFLNSEVRIPAILTNGTSTVATISREFSLVAQDTSVQDGGVISIYTRPYIIGDQVGLIPQRPYFNSPHIASPNGFTVRVKSGSALPPGLSLDQQSGLVYGNLLGTYGSKTGGHNASILEYVDTDSIVRGTTTIFWDTLPAGPTLTSNLTNGALGTAYSNTITSSSSNTLSTASVYRGVLPAGLTIASVTGNTVTIAGTPTEAGYFDIWFKVTDSGTNVAYIYQRLAIEFITPLTILTTSLPPIVETVAYSQTLQGYGGVPPYTWGSNMPSAWPALDGYFTPHDPDPSTGSLDATVPSDSGLDSQTNIITFTLTDSDGHTATPQPISISVNNALQITTTAIPAITLAQAYSFTMSAVGGIPAYTWSLIGGSLPAGITINSSGVISGTTSDSGYGTQTLTFKVTDSTSAFITATLPVTVGVVAGMAITTSSVGPIFRGVNYLGTLSVIGSTYTPPVSWQIASTSANQLPAGLTLTPTPANSGATATISGLYTGPAFTGYSITVQAQDIAGHVATATFNLAATTNLLVTTPASLPNAVVGVALSGAAYQFTATGGGSPSGGTPVLTWSIPSPPPGFPFILTSSGVLQGTAPSTGTWTFTAQVVDTLTPVDSATKSITITASTSTLAITTATLPNVTAGVAYSTSLAASGGAAPYTWAIVAGALPSGLSLNSSTGAITGTTLTVGPATITFQVKDSISSTVQKQFTLTVINGMTLQAGIDFTNSTSLNILGYITSADNVGTLSGPNDSFYVVAHGVIGTAPSQLTASASSTVGSGFTAVVQSVASGVALVKLSGPFASGTVGNNTINVTINDINGINKTSAFTWVVYTAGALRAAIGTGSIPSWGVPVLQGTAAQVNVYNNPSSSTFTFPTYNSQTVTPALAATSDFTLSGDTTAFSGRVSFGFTNSNFQLSYNGTAPVLNTAKNILTLLEKDIAWYNSVGSTFDLFSTGPSLSLPFIYMVKPTPVVSPVAFTISPSNVSGANSSGGKPNTEAIDGTTTGFTGWTAIGKLASGGQDTVTLFGNPTVDTSQTLNLTNYLLAVPSNATITTIVVTPIATKTAGTSNVFINAKMLGITGATNQNQSLSSGGGNSFVFSPGSTTFTQTNAAGFGVAIFFNCTDSPGTGATITLSSVTIQINYTTPNYEFINVVLSEPFSPYQLGTQSGAAGSGSVSISASMSNGVTVASTTAVMGTGALAGFLTGWVIAAQFPNLLSGSMTSVLNVVVNGTLTYLNGTALVTGGAISYFNSNTTITATSTGTTGGGGGGTTITPVSITSPAVNLSSNSGVAYAVQFAASGGTKPYTWSGGPANSTGIDLDSTGLLSGFPRATGTFTFNVTVTDSSSPIQNTTKAFTMTVS